MHPLPEITTPPAVITALADPLRWNIIRALLHSDYRVNELSAWVNHPANLVSYHLKQLREADLVVTRRSDADGRDMYYHLRRDRLQTLFFAAGQALRLSAEGSAAAPPRADAAPIRVLFICTGNSARSQMAEGLLRALAGEQFHVFSAGSAPSHVHPDAIQTMAAQDIDISAQYSKDFTIYKTQPFDYVITVCDRAREVCPTFPGDGVHLHWSIPNPADITDPAARKQAFRAAAVELETRIRFLLADME